MKWTCAWGWRHQAHSQSKRGVKKAVPINLQMIVESPFGATRASGISPHDVLPMSFCFCRGGPKWVVNDHGGGDSRFFGERTMRVGSQGWMRTWMRLPHKFQPQCIHGGIESIGEVKIISHSPRCWRVMGSHLSQKRVQLCACLCQSSKLEPGLHSSTYRPSTPSCYEMRE